MNEESSNNRLLEENNTLIYIFKFPEFSKGI